MNPDTIVGGVLMLVGLIGLGYWAITRSVADAADWPALAAAEDEWDAIKLAILTDDFGVRADLQAEHEQYRRAER